MCLTISNSVQEIEWNLHARSKKCIKLNEEAKSNKIAKGTILATGTTENLVYIIAKDTAFPNSHSSWSPYIK